MKLGRAIGASFAVSEELEALNRPYAVVSS